MRETASDARADLRAAVRAFCAEHDPAATSRAAFLSARFDAGLAAVHYPVGHGGRGLPRTLQPVAEEEFARAGAVRPDDRRNVIGLGMAAPTIIAFGSDEQKSRWLKPLWLAEEIWCQLFSEPGAGSDLAGLATRAVRDGDDWVVNGQKVWTSLAHHARWGLLLARTDPDVPKHKGLTMFIVPMDSPGVTVRGLRQISGEAEFNEVFFDDVRLDADAVVGGVGNGWGTALTVLMYERLTIGFGSEGFGSPTRLAQTLAADDGARHDADARRRLGEVITELLAVRYNGYRALTALSRGQIPGPEAGLAKVTMVNAAIAATDLGADVVGPDALGADSEWSYLISFLPGLKSAGGTEQVLRNTIGERVLGLPPEPRLDKGVPFSELRAMEKQAVTS